MANAFSILAASRRFNTEGVFDRERASCRGLDIFHHEEEAKKHASK
jgi:hypothetical protein